MKEFIKNIPVLGSLAVRLNRYLRGKPESWSRPPFSGSKGYWSERYEKGGNSGPGSYGKLAEFKARVINDFVSQRGITSVIEFGSGDGNQLKLSKYPNYIGFDVSESVIRSCRELFKADKRKSFKMLSDYNNETAELVLSLDVTYHLVEVKVFETHMTNLFQSSERYVIIYSCNSNDNRGFEGTHEYHRRFTDWIVEHATDWELISHIPNPYPFENDITQGSRADFYLYQKR